MTMKVKSVDEVPDRREWESRQWKLPPPVHGIILAERQSQDAERRERSARVARLAQENIDAGHAVLRELVAEAAELGWYPFPLDAGSYYPRELILACDRPDLGLHKLHVTAVLSPSDAYRVAAHRPFAVRTPRGTAHYKTLAEALVAAAEHCPTPF